MCPSEGENTKQRRANPLGNDLELRGEGWKDRNERKKINKSWPLFDACAF